MTNNTLTLKQIRPLLEYLLTQNSKLTSQGLSPLAVGLEGEAGIGKTSIIENIVKERNMTYCKLNLSQLEEVGDLTGMPQKEVYCVDPNKSEGSDLSGWYLEKQIPCEVTATIRTRTTYARPGWLPEEENPNGTVLLLDDYSRSTPIFMNAVMELINTGSYVSWSLPKNTTIMLTSNPDDGEYSVVGLDEAQRTRMLTFTVKADKESWAKWAEKVHLDGRTINFALKNWNELFCKQDREGNPVKIMNQRSYVSFCKAISGISDWNANKDLILEISKGCFSNDEDNYVGTLFINFLSDELDKLPEPEYILKENWKNVLPTMKKVVFDSNGKARHNIQAILTIRIINYLETLYNEGGKFDLQPRILDIINCADKILSSDLIFRTIVGLTKKYPDQLQKVAAHPKVLKEIMI